MNKKILAILLTGVVCAPFTAVANSDDSQYPASNFQPTVIFADESVISSNTSIESSTFDANYPAASFQPKILYIDTSATSSTAKGETSSFDPKYPAANFEPKIIYP